jgi:catechol 2,3-dioxygenase-like lactoylglutathione lyase family enzyme
MSTPGTEGVSHTALTVTDLDASVAWYTRIFEAMILWQEDQGDHKFVLLFAPPLAIGLNTHAATTAKDMFDERRVGLDHISFQVENRDALEAWAKRLDELDIAHSPVTEAPYGTVLVFRDPDNIQLEFFALPG